MSDTAYRELKVIWEYKTVSGHLFENELNEVGKYGWELVTIRKDTYYFKRKIVLDTRTCLKVYGV